jgi:CheY-like chemotaxis protein
MPQTILIAEDNDVVLSYVAAILRKQGFETLQAIDGLDALRQVEERRAPVDLLLTDIRMPRMDGLALAHSIHEMYPATPILYMSGYSFDLQEERTVLAPSHCTFLAKPFTRQTLLDAVQAILGRKPSEAQS